MQLYLYQRISKEQVSEFFLTSEERKEIIEKMIDNSEWLENESNQKLAKASSSIGYSLVLLLMLVGGGIAAFEWFGIEGRTTVIIIATLLLGFYFYFSYKKLIIFQSQHYRDWLTIRDNLSTIIGLSIIYMLQGFVHIGTSTFNFLGVFLAVLFFLPTIQTNQRIKKLVLERVRKEF
ncbi:hypothetical protein BTS2_0358 [Bacillus sp. TS-2]|nr:hypothetical protein BTS2_0358 [Bacillus sp. TS-2]